MESLKLIDDLELESTEKLDLDLMKDFDSTIETIKGINDIENQTLTLDIVCKYCGDKRATVTIKYKTMKDQGYFRAVCICEKCQKK